MTNRTYTTRLQAGLGLIPETEKLLGLWEPGMDTRALLDRALESGEFPSMTARRLRNIVSEGFGPRYLTNGGKPASALKSMREVLTDHDRRQLFFLFTCRANPILADFVRDLYWPQYTAGGTSITKWRLSNQLPLRLSRYVAADLKLPSYHFFPTLQPSWARCNLQPDDSGMIPARWSWWMEAIDAERFCGGYQGVILVAGVRNHREHTLLNILV